jgi:peptide/nickel transport system permease protein
MILMMMFAYRLPWLPAAGMRTPGDGSLVDLAVHMAMPLVVLSAGSFAYYVRFVRFAVLDCLTADYVRTARAKGLPTGRILIRHVLPNAAIPIVTVAALSLPMLFTGALITENVFSWPGVGRFVIASTLARDYPVIMFVNFSMAVLTALANLLADLAYLVVDPRVRLNQ